MPYPDCLPPLLYLVTFQLFMCFRGSNPQPALGYCNMLIYLGYMWHMSKKHPHTSQGTHTQSTSLHQKTHQAKTQYIDIKPRRKQKHVHTYCGWRKYCTSWLVVYPIIYRGSTKGGAGFLPSTVSGENNTELMFTQRKSKPYPNTPSHPSSPPGISGFISESRRNLPTVMMKNIN